jgi:WD40 repeat protein
MKGVLAEVLDGFVRLVYARSMLRPVISFLFAVVLSVELHGAPQRATASQPPDRLLQSGHTSSIQALALSSDGHWMASGGYDKTVIVWNAATGEEQWRLTGHSDPIIALAFSPDGGRLASASTRGRVKIWDVLTGVSSHSANMHSAVRVIAFSSDGQLWAASVDAVKEGATAKIEIHNATSGNVIRTVSTPWGFVTALTITPEGLLVASGGIGEDDEDQGSVQIWNVASGEIVKTYPVIANAFSRNGRFMARIDYLKDPKRIVVSDVTTGQQKQAFAASNPGAVFFDASGQEVAVTDPMKSELRIWSVTTGAEIKTIPADQSIGALGLNAAAFSGDGKTVAAAPYPGNSIKMWDLATGRELRRFEGQSPVQGLAVTPNGRWLVVSSQLGVNLWDVATGKRVANLSQGPVNFLVLSRDGRWLATNPGARFPGETLRVWDMKGRTPAADFTFGKGGTPMLAMAFVPPNSLLTSLGPFSRSWEFTADDGKHAIWSGSSPIASSPDQKLLVAQFGIGGNLDVWDLMSGRKLTTLSAHNMSVSTVSFSPDGRLLVTTGQESPPTGNFAGGNQGNEWGMKVWDVATWKPRISISFLRVGAPCAAFSPDGRQVAVEKSWETVELLDADNGASLGVLTATDPQPQSHQFSSRNLAFNANGTLLFQGAQNGVRVWKLAPR